MSPPRSGDAGSCASLVDLAQASEGLARRLMAGEASANDLQDLLGWRQQVIDALPRPATAKLTPEELEAVRRIGQVDDTLWAWCRAHQAELRAQLTNSRRQRRPAGGRPRIFSQEA